MRSNLSLSDLCTVVVLALVVAPAAAIDCRNVPTSFGPIPPEVLAACGGRGATSRPALGFANQAISPEGIGATCSEMTLDDPAATTLFGSIDFRPACDFAGSDTSGLYCLSFTNPSTLSRVDTTTCNEGTIGACVLNGGQLPSGLAWDPDGFTMFMSSTSGGRSELYTVDLTTGACTFVGDMGDDAPGNIALAADCEQLYGYDIVNDSAYSISRGTGRATLLGPLGFDANFAQGMDCDPSNDTCYVFAFNNTTFTGQLRTLDTTDGSTTLIGDIGPTGFEDWTGPGIPVFIADQCGGCGLNVQMPRLVRPGELVQVHLSISHRRSVPVEVPFALEIRDRRGRVLLADQTRAYRLRYGDTVSTSHTLQMPGLGPGVYELVVSMAEMRGGTEVATLPFRIR